VNVANQKKDELAKARHKIGRSKINGLDFWLQNHFFLEHPCLRLLGSRLRYKLVNDAKFDILWLSNINKVIENLRLGFLRFENLSLV
jgi:hypothetical protein